MPYGDGTGPWWAQEKNLKCERTFGRGYGLRWQRIPITKPVILTKDQQKSMLEEELKEIDAEKQEIEKRLKELTEHD
jgi:hypothetical protein